MEQYPPQQHPQQYPQQYPTQPQYAPQQVSEYGPRQSQYDPGIKHAEQANIAQLYQDEEHRRVSVMTSKGRPKPNYRPASLQWWYIGFLIGVFLGLGCAMVYADLKLRGSDSTATIEARSLSHDEAWMLYVRGLDEEVYRRQDPGAPTTPPAVPAQPTEPAGVPPVVEKPAAGDTPVLGVPTTPPTVPAQPTDPVVGPPVVETPGGGQSPPDAGQSPAPGGGQSPPPGGQSPAPGGGESPAPGVGESPPPGGGETPASETPSPLGPGERIATGPVEVETRITVSAAASTETVTSEVTVVNKKDVTETETVTSPNGVVATNTITTEKDVTSVTSVTVTNTYPASVYVRIGVTTVYSTYTVNSAGQRIEGPKTSVETAEIAGTFIESIQTLPPTAVVTIGPDGLPTTIMSTPSPITHITSVPPTKTVITHVSRPTATGKVVVEGTRFELTNATYFIGKFLPVLVAVVLALAVRAVDQTAKLYQPFAALAHPLGATGRDSLNLHFDGWLGFWRPFFMVSKGHPVPLLSTLAVWLSTALAPLAASAIGLKIHGRCRKGSIDGCALKLGVSSLEAWVLVGVLLLLALLLLGLLVAVSRRWKTGVFADPWCAAGAAALLRNPDVRSIGAPDFRSVKAAISEKQFTLGWFRNHEGREEYGLVLCDEDGRSLRGARREQEGSDMMVQTAYAEAARYQSDGHVRMVRRPPVTFVSLTFWWRLLFLIYLVALMGVVIYYQLGIKVPTNLRNFVEGRTFGMRFILSALGMVVIMCWDAIYCSVAIIAPYRRMANGPQGASRSVLAKRPTYAVTGIYAGIRERDLLLFGVAVMAVLSYFLPMIFANVPYDLTQTKEVHTVCARISAGVLFIMAAALTASMFVRWPELPVDPRSVAGEIWYVAEARWVDRLEGVAVMSDGERKKRVVEMGRKWYYGLTNTCMGERMGIEMNDVYGTTEYSGFR